MENREADAVLTVLIQAGTGFMIYSSCIFAEKRAAFSVLSEKYAIHIHAKTLNYIQNYTSYHL